MAHRFLLLTVAAAGSKWVQVVLAEVAAALLHDFTLVHADIQDASPTRRTA